MLISTPLAPIISVSKYVEYVISKYVSLSITYNNSHKDENNYNCIGVPYHICFGSSRFVKFHKQLHLLYIDFFVKLTRIDIFQEKGIIRNSTKTKDVATIC